MSKNKPVITNLGKIDGRNGIYLDDVKQTFSPNKLFFNGEIDGKLCSNNAEGYRWYSYELYFSLVQAYNCMELELCKLKVESSFDEIIDSELITKFNLDGKSYKHYILSTYDYVYSIISKEFNLKITGHRNG
ncbi:UNVERIFIED_CONTAM: hypothetical protein Cloal_1000 [Acetivibrio alkalicellulosi]